MHAPSENLFAIISMAHGRADSLDGNISGWSRHHPNRQQEQDDPVALKKIRTSTKNCNTRSKKKQFVENGFHDEMALADRSC